MPLLLHLFLRPDFEKSTNVGLAVGHIQAVLRTVHTSQELNFDHIDCIVRTASILALGFAPPRKGPADHMGLIGIAVGVDQKEVAARTMAVPEASFAVAGSGAYLAVSAAVLVVVGGAVAAVVENLVAFGWIGAEHHSLVLKVAVVDVDCPSVKRPTEQPVQSARQVWVTPNRRAAAVPAVCLPQVSALPSHLGAAEPAGPSFDQQVLTIRPAVAVGFLSPTHHAADLHLRFVAFFEPVVVSLVAKHYSGRPTVVPDSAAWKLLSLLPL